PPTASALYTLCLHDALPISFEDRLQAARVAAAPLGTGVELGKVRAGPEALLEAVGLVLGAVEQAALAEDDHPRRDRGDQQQQHRSEEHTSELQSRENLVCRL